MRRFVANIVVFELLFLVLLGVSFCEEQQQQQFYSSLYTPEYISKFDDSGIKRLFSLFAHVNCTYNVLGHCQKGTVRPDPWLLNALKTQDQLTMDMPINQLQWIGSHNAFNNRADGYGEADSILRKILQFFVSDLSDLVLAQQEYTMTDQMNFGVRMLQLDPQWFMNEMRLCHAGNDYKWIDSAVKYIEEVIGVKFDFDSHQIGCSPFDRPWRDGIREIYEWVTRNEEEIIMIYVNDHFTWDWSHTNLVIDPIIQYFVNTSLLFTPSDLVSKFEGQWPSKRQLLDMKKRVIIFGTEYACQSPLMFCDIAWLSTYPYNNQNQFMKFPICTDKHAYENGTEFSFEKDWNIVGGESVVYGPFYSGPEDAGLITPDNVEDHTDCGVKIIALDQASPALVSSTVWTWAREEPRLVALNKCVYMRNAADTEQSNFKGTWYAGSCSLSLRYACESDIEKGDWIVSTQSVSLSHEMPHCPPDYHFSYPSSPYYAKLLKEKMKEVGAETVWLNQQL